MKPDVKEIKLELPNEITIIRADNGFIVSNIDQLISDEDNVYSEVKTVFEDGNIESDEVFDDQTEAIKELKPKEISMYYLLQYIKEFFGCHYDKHRKVNLSIEIEDFRSKKEEEEDGST